MPILRRFYSIYRRTPIMDKRNKTALAYLLIGVAAAGRALLSVPENAAIHTRIFPIP